MKDRKLAVRYARALFAAIPDASASEAVAQFLDAVGSALSGSRELRDRILDPAVPRAKREAAFAALAAKAEMPKGVSNFLKTIVDNNRIAALPTIAEVFSEMREEAMGVVPAEITTATPMTPEQEQRARDAVERMTGRKVILSTKVDGDLIGGAVTRIGSTIYDGSLRSQLGQLERRMTGE